MTWSIVLDNDSDRGTVTMKPSWLARLFGRRTRIARVHRRSGNDWYFIDGGWVGNVFEKQLNHERRWRVVSELPQARVLKRGPNEQ